MEYIRRCTLLFFIALIAACSTIQAPEVTSQLSESFVQEPTKVQLKSEAHEVSPQESIWLNDLALAKAITVRYKCPLQVAVDSVRYARKYAYKDFPKKEHILAFIAVESRFNPSARQGGSRGVMQVLVKTHRSEIQGKFDLPEQIRVGSIISRSYYEATNGINAAIMSYNVGVGGYRRGARPKQYFNRYMTELAWIKGQDRTGKLV